MITLDPTLHIGDLLIAITVAVGGGGVVWRLSGRFGKIESNIEINRAIASKEFETVRSILNGQNLVVTELKNEVRDLRNVLVNQAEMRAQIIALQQRVTEMAHGEGFVLPTHKGAYERGGG